VVSLAKIRCVLFDAVGTLIEADPPVAAVYQAAGSRYGSQLSVEQIEQRFRTALAWHHRDTGPTSEAAERRRWQRIVADVIADVTGAQAAVFEELWSHFAEPQHWRLYEDVEGTLTVLHRRGFRLGIASNFDQRLRQVAAGHAALALCERQFISAELGYLKPDPRFFRAVEERLDLAPSEIALVGDDDVADVFGAAAAGWRAIRLDRAGRSRSTDSIHSLSELV
jgi:putative hydrolase of the HAD superfamily